MIRPPRFCVVCHARIGLLGGTQRYCQRKPCQNERARAKRASKSRTLNPKP